MRSTLDQLPGRLTSDVWPHTPSDSVTSNGNASTINQDGMAATIEKGGVWCIYDLNFGVFSPYFFITLLFARFERILCVRILSIHACL